MASTKPRKKPKPRRSQRRLQPETQGQTHRLSAKTSLVWTGVIFLLHTLGLALLFVPMTGLFNSQPVIEQDWGLHFHHLKSMEAFWSQDGRLWGYNPLFMAGYPSNTIQDLSIKLFEVLALLLSVLKLDVTQAFKLTAFMATAAVPWMMFFAARNLFTREPPVPLVATVLGTAYWWDAYPREMFFSGMIGFPLSAYFSLVIISLFYRIVRAERDLTPAHWGWLAAAIVLLPLHLQTVLILAPVAVALLILYWGSPSGRLLAWIGAGALVSCLVNLIWLWPAFTHRADDASTAIVAQLPVFATRDILMFLKDYLTAGDYWTFRPSLWTNGLRWLLLILGLMGLVKLIRAEQRDIGVMLGCGVATLFLLTYFGSFVPSLRALQPLRFKVPYDLFLVLTSAYLVSSRRREPSSARRPIFVPVCLALGLITAATNIFQTELGGKLRLRTEVSPALRAIAAWIRDQTPTDGRILFEESGDETDFFYDDMYLSSFIPYWTGRQLIGGPINLYNDRHHFAEFHSGMLFKRDIKTFTDEELAAYFRTYNIAAVVAFHPQSVRRLLSVPGLVSLDRRLGDLHLFRVDQPLNWFLKGKGELRASLNGIQGSNVSGAEVILKYHWTPGLVSNPPATILPEKILEDPIPFIKIINPASEFTLQIRR